MIFTDALNMRGVTAFYEPGKLDVQALVAGNDILLRPENIPVAFEEIINAINSGLIKEEDINNSVKKILSMAPGCKVVDDRKDGGYITPVEAIPQLWIAVESEDKSKYIIGMEMSSGAW